MNKATTIVLLHGHGVDSSIWDALYEALSADYQLLKPDFSTLTNHNTIEAYAEDVYGMLQSALVEKAMLIGHSMGGYIALAFAERHPDMVSSLVLVNSTVLADDEARKIKRQEAIGQMKQHGSAVFISETIPKMFAESTKVNRADEVQKRIEMGNKMPSEALIAGVKAMATRPDRSHVVREAAFPVLVVAGKEDAIIPFDKSEQMANLLNDKGQFAALDKTGHLSMIEQPDELLRLIQEFLVKA